ncbi:MAG TPA: PilW family protein [Thiobacillus sp.]|nr:PilW family protein [Thiobacillus sp.]
MTNRLIFQSARMTGPVIQRGLSLIELMIAITLGMLVMAALLALFINITRNNSELARVNSQIENGRFAIQVLENDIVHAGFWGTHVPQFDDLTYEVVPTDAPTAVPDPCLEAASWNAVHKNNLITIPVQAYNASPGSCVTNKFDNTDVLVVRHADTCAAGSGGNCEADIAGKLYFQHGLCEAPMQAQAGSINTITLEAGASATDDFYNGARIRIVSGAGQGQIGVVGSAAGSYVGATKVATMSANWAIAPDVTSKYVFDSGYVLGDAGFPFTKRDCTTAADKRKYVSNIYYIRNYAATAGDGIPTLVRSTFGTSAGGAEALIEGIDGFNVEIGVDNQSETGAAPVYTAAVAWADPATKLVATNRGDGEPDEYVRCAATCTVDQLANAVAVKLYVLARAKEATAGYTDTKIYQMGTVSRGPFNDGFKRHVFSTTVRLANVSGRRETP